MPLEFQACDPLPEAAALEDLKPDRSGRGKPPDPPLTAGEGLP